LQKLRRGKGIVKDKIILKGMRFYGHHGYFEAEKSLGQWFNVDVEIVLDLSKAALSDALEETINYAALYQVIKRAVEQGRSFDLIEAVAGRIMKGCFQFNKVEAVKVRVEKPQVPLGGPIDYTAVELERTREEWEAQQVEGNS